MEPWFIATEKFGPQDGDGWLAYVEWSKLHQADEIVSLDRSLCTPILADFKDEYWPYVVNEDYMLNYFVDLQFLRAQISGIINLNLLCVYRNPLFEPESFDCEISFEMLGYDLIDVNGGNSALTNCGGFPEAFSGSELSTNGLIRSHARALDIQSNLRRFYPDEHHANCDVWAISRAARV